MNWVKDDGSPDWTFEIVGYVNAGENDERVFANELYFNYEYLDEARATGKGTVHQYVVAIDDASRATEISQAIDHLFANSSAETTTLNEREYVVAQLRQVGDVRMFVNSIIGAVLFTLLFLAGNTMSQSVRRPDSGTRRAEDAGLQRHRRVGARRRRGVAAVRCWPRQSASRSQPRCFRRVFALAEIHGADPVAAARSGASASASRCCWEH